MPATVKHTGDLITDRILSLIERLKKSGEIRFTQEFLDVAGMRKQNFVKVQNQERYFTEEHIAAICKEYRVNANWIFGLERSIFREPTTRLHSSSKKLNKKLNKGRKTEEK